MTDNQRLQKKIEQTEYRAKMLENELNAVRQSKAYKAARSLGIVKKRIKSDPVGLTKKVVQVLLNDPKKLKTLLGSANRINLMELSVVEQNGKYQEWILLNEPDETELEQQRVAGDLFGKKPLISIITPVFNPPTDVLEDLIESVLEQTYSNFELCLGDFGDSESVQELLEKYAKIDHRVKYTVFKDNKGIAENSNQILDTVKGDYIALLDHDDTLSPDALFENVKKINEESYDFLYSDKDKIDINGNRFEPLFKPQLSPEMLLNINYLTHLNLMKTSIVKEIGGWDSDTDGAQDWDLFLRVIARSTKVAHIPKVLYHWRVIASSTAMSIETKPYALAGQRKAVDKYLALNKIPAKAFHKKTEMFLDWDNEVVDKNPLVYIYFSNITNTLRTIRHIRKQTSSQEFRILVESSINLSDREVDKLKHAVKNLSVYAYDQKNLYTTLHKSMVGSKEKTALFISDLIRLPKTDWYEDLAGWLAIKEVVAASGRILDSRDLIVDSGALVTGDGKYYPLFRGYPRFYQSYLGNAEWVRDLSIISSNFFITKVDALNKFDLTKSKKLNPMFDDFFLWASQGSRIVMTPHVTGVIHGMGVDINAEHPLNLSNITKTKYVDAFGNVNMSSSDPLRLFQDEVLEGHDAKDLQEIDAYQHDAIILTSSFDISDKEIKANLALLNTPNKQTPHSVAWFLPSFDAVYAGLMNIFSFAHYLSEKKGLKTTIYILKNSTDVSNEKLQVVSAFPGLKGASFVGIRPDQVSAIKDHDIGIATQWATAYPLAKAMNITRKCYFIQDNEVNFYPKGSISSLVELSYTFGFTAIANTAGLLDMYEKKYGGKGAVLKSVVDLSAYVPRKDVHYVPKPTYKVFFYARPNMPRNAFELGIAGLKLLKSQLGNKVEIITAGAEWDASQYGVEGLFTNLGKINYDAVPKLYRSVDAGVMFMFSGHPGVTASELMASGCPVVVNEYDDITWQELYQDEVTCLVTKATASEVARNVRRLLEDTKLRKKLITKGLETTKSFYVDYDASCDKAFTAISN